jgi:opacity protein-like surface antigen
VVPISALLMLRSPFLKSDEFPKGQLQPYVGIGPSFFVANGSLDSPSPGIDAVHQGRTDFGFDVRAGLAWQINKNFAIFSEYRFTDVNLRFLHRECFAVSCGPLDTDIVSETRVSLVTHHVLVGVRF